MLTNIFESSQVGINLLVAISNSGKTTYIKNLIDAIVEPFRKKRDNDLYNKLKCKKFITYKNKNKSWKPCALLKKKNPEIKKKKQVN